MRRIALIFSICLMSVIFCTACDAKVRQYSLKVVKEYPHDIKSYTQGLFFYKGEMYETTGQYGSSTFRKVDISTGKAAKSLKFNRKYFAEGSTELDGKVYILTWESKVAFIYDAATMAYESSYSYPREGWGITNDGKQLIASDGSSRLYFLDKNFRLQKTLNVTHNGRSMRMLNELEYIDGKIWANVYLTDIILIINPEDGKVESVIDCSGLLPDKLRTPHTDVLNGIAYNPIDGKIYLTGKNWPRLYEINLVEKKN